MKITINTTTFPASANDPVPAFVLEQVKALHAIDRSIELDVLIPHNAYGDPLPDQVHHDSHREIRYHYFFPKSAEKLAGRGILPAIRENPLRFALVPFFLYFQYRALLDHCRRTRPDVVYAHWFMTPAIVSYFACRRLGIPLVFTTHASDMSVLNAIPFARRLVASVMQYAHHYTAVSNRTANKMKAFFTDQEWRDQYASKLSILPMGTGLDDGKMAPKTQKNLLSKAGVNTDRKLILCMGRLSEKKGIGYLIDAFERLDESHRQACQLVIAGDGQLMDELKAQASRLIDNGNAVFTGFASGDLKRALIHQAHMFVLPSIIDSSGDSEGLPVAMMEALTMGRIVVATNVSGAEEVLTDDVGILVDQKSTPALTQALTRVLELSARRRATMQRKARALSTKFHWDAIAEKHLKILKRAAAHARPKDETVRSAPLGSQPEAYEKSA